MPDKKQGYIVDGLCILVWENNLEEIQKPFEGCSFDDDEDGYIPESNTGEINKTLTIASITGTKNKYKSDSKTLLIMFDSATTGRLSMTEYAEVATSDYLSNLENGIEIPHGYAMVNAVLFLYMKLPLVLMAMKKEVCLSRAKKQKRCLSATYSVYRMRRKNTAGYSKPTVHQSLQIQCL